MKDYYIPSSKYELVNTLAIYYPKDRQKFWSWKKDRLYAVYYRIRRKHEFNGN